MKKPVLKLFTKPEYVLYWYFDKFGFLQLEIMKWKA